MGSGLKEPGKIAAVASCYRHQVTAAFNLDSRSMQMPSCACLGVSIYIFYLS